MKDRIKIIVGIVLGMMVSAYVQAEFKFIITRGYDQPTTVAVVPFCW